MYQIIGTKALSGNLPKFEFKYFEIELLHVTAIHPFKKCIVAMHFSKKYMSESIQDIYKNNNSNIEPL
jgi:hypothetical protein